MPNDIEKYYNEESTKYSYKRYEGVTDTYVKYFFRRRLALVLNYLAAMRLNVREDGPHLLEVGCADGVVLRKIALKTPGKFGKLVGVDIAEDMLVQACLVTKDSNISFFHKSETPIEKFDVALAVGFVDPGHWQEEKNYLLKHLKPGGHVVISLGARYSLHARLKLVGKDYAKQYLTYKEYDKLLTYDFEIVAKRYYGLFVPKLWAIPTLARLLQPVFDRLLAPLVPGLFHECLYLLRSKSR